MTSAQPPDPQPLPSRELRRSQQRMLGGVCGGVAEYLGISAGLVRIVTLLLMCMGHGVLLYLAGWLLLPDGDKPSAWTSWRSRRAA